MQTFHSRCHSCKTVLSPSWTSCRVCHTPIRPNQSSPSDSISTLLVGDRIVYRDEVTKQLREGTVRQTQVQHGGVCLTLDAGLTVKGRQVRAKTITSADGSVLNAVTLQEGDLLMAATPPQKQSFPSSQPSPWLQHWKDIAILTHGILPHEPRLKSVLTMIDRCNEAFIKQDEAGFLRIKQQLTNFITASAPRAQPPKHTSP